MSARRLVGDPLCSMLFHLLFSIGWLGSDLGRRDRGCFMRSSSRPGPGSVAVWCSPDRILDLLGCSAHKWMRMGLYWLGAVPSPKGLVRNRIVWRTESSV